MSNQKTRLDGAVHEALDATACLLGESTQRDLVMARRHVARALVYLRKVNGRMEEGQRAMREAV